MFVNTGGGGKSQQQQPLQNQLNASVRHTNPYQQTHTQQQPHYEHHQGPVAFVAYPFCNVAAAPHGNTGGNNVTVTGGQGGHMLFQTSHQPQSQPHPTQQQVGIHNTEQALHYFAKSAPLPAHHQQHSQIRNMIAVSHQRQPYVVSPNYYALPHALLQQQPRTSILTNAAPQHAMAAASGAGSIAAQLQNTTPRNVAPSGPTAYVPPQYCTPPLLLGAAPTAVTPQPGPMMTAPSGMGQPPLQAYAHISAGLSAAPTSSTPISIQNLGVGVGVGNSHNTEHNHNTKQRIHAIPIVHPDTLEIVTLEHLDDNPPKPQPPTQIKSEISVESVSIQTDNDKSLTASVASDPSDVVLTTHSQSTSATADTDKIDYQTQTEQNNSDMAKQASELATETAAFISAPDANTTTQSVHSGSESLKISVCQDANDTDADTNEHELDNEDVVLDATDGNLSIACTDQQLPTSVIIEQQTEEIPTPDLDIPKSLALDTDHSTETEVKSKDEPCTISVQTSLDKKEEEKSKESHTDVQPSVSSYVVTESKKARRKAKRNEKHPKKSKQQQNKSNNMSTQNEENKSKMLSKTTGNDKKVLEVKSQPENEEPPPTFLRYSLEELKALANSPESCKTPVVPCQKGDCISQLFVARQQHHHHVLSHQNLAAAINMQHHVQQSYHHMNFSESIEFVSGKRRVGGGGGGAVARKHQDHQTNSASSGNNIGGQPATAGTSGNTNQVQKKMQVIHINLSLNEEIKLSECKNAWQPKFLTNSANNNSTKGESGKNANNIEDLLKKVRGILNKLTSENFDVLVKEMTKITINTQDQMQKFMLLIFEKTVSEPNFAPTYAKFSKVLFEEVKAENKEIFHNLLIKRLEKEFELNVNNADAKERKLQQIINKLKETKDQQEKIELQAELEHQEYQFRRRAWGTVRFIGEMYKLHSLSANRVFLYVESLLKHGNEEKLEYMCKLLTTVGNLLENSDSESFSNNNNNNNNNNARMNKIFTKIQTIVKEAKDPSNKKTKICSRVRFMMQDLIDLRSRNWGQSSYAHSSHIALRRRLPDDRSSNMPSGSLSNYEKGSSQRMSFGNNNRQNQTRSKESGAGGSSGNYFMQKPSKSQYLGQREQQSIDLKKLNFSRGDDHSQANTKLGKQSTYMWRTITGHQSSDDRNSPTSSQLYTTNQQPQKHQPQQQQQQQAQYWGDIKAILETCSSKDNQKLLNHLMEEYLDCLSSRSNRWREEVLNAWQKTNNKQQICLLYYILMDYLHLGSVKRLERNACASIFIYLMTCNALNKTIFTRAYEKFAEEFPDLLMDVPNGWTYVFQFIGPLLHERLITFSDIWHTNWRNDQYFTDRFVNALVVYFTKDFGANYMRDLWHKEFKLDRGQQFKSDQQQWRQFVADNKLQFLYDCKTKPEIMPTNTSSNSSTLMDQHVQRLQILLSSPNDSNLALDYINTNVNINSYFLKNLTRFLCCDYAIITTKTSSATMSQNSSTCSNSSSSSSTKNPDVSNNAQLNVEIFRNKCLPLLRLCLDAHEDHELACLDSVVDAIQDEYDTHTANKLICGIFDIFYDCEVIAKESFEKWFTQRQQDHKKYKEPLNSDLKAYLQKLL